MKRMAFLLVLIAPLTASADGWAGLSGKNSEGALVSVEPSQLFVDKDYQPNDAGPGFIPKPESRSIYDVHVQVGKAYKTYERQHCDFEVRNGRRSFFSCSSSGQSPLAGTTYKIIPNPQKNCDYQYKFVCVKGCGKASTPEMLIQGWWECEVP